MIAAAARQLFCHQLSAMPPRLMLPPMPPIDAAAQVTPPLLRLMIYAIDAASHYYAPMIVVDAD